MFILSIKISLFAHGVKVMLGHDKETTLD
jgi:hypothetical protein